MSRYLNKCACTNVNSAPDHCVSHLAECVWVTPLCLTLGSITIRYPGRAGTESFLLRHVIIKPDDIFFLDLTQLTVPFLQIFPFPVRLLNLLSQFHFTHEIIKRVLKAKSNWSRTSSPDSPRQIIQKAGKSKWFSLSATERPCQAAKSRVFLPLSQLIKWCIWKWQGIKIRFTF